MQFMLKEDNFFIVKMLRVYCPKTNKNEVWEDIHILKDRI